MNIRFLIANLLLSSIILLQASDTASKENPFCDEASSDVEEQFKKAKIFPFSKKICSPKSDWSLLHQAAAVRSVAAVREYIQTCDLNAQDSDGNTPLHVVMTNYSEFGKKDCDTIVQLLRDAKADTSIKNHDGKTLLNIAKESMLSDDDDWVFPLPDFNTDFHSKSQGSSSKKKAKK